MNPKPSLSRRKFAGLLAATPAAATALQAQQPPAGAPNPNTSLQPEQKRQGTVDGILPFKDPIQFQRKDVAAKVQAFPLSQVRLLPSVFLDAAEWNRGYMKSSAGGPAAAQLPPECRIALQRGAARRLGDLRCADAGRTAQ